jgi:hypothetical protein
VQALVVQVLWSSDLVAYALVVTAVLAQVAAVASPALAVAQLVVMVVPPLVVEVMIPQMLEMAVLPAAEPMTPLLGQAV